MNYRHEAKMYLQRAEVELSSGDDQRLKYAALELRMAMEAVTFDRALAHKDEIPTSEYETWQPRKVLALLLEIDPNIDRDAHLAYGPANQDDITQSEWTSLGTDKVLNMATLKKHYDALGSYLHVQTMKHALANQEVDYSKFKNRCEEIVAYLKNVLSSPIFNLRMGVGSTMECDSCGNPVRTRLPFGKKSVEAFCQHCAASYAVEDAEPEGENCVRWYPQLYTFDCKNTDCTGELSIWRREIKIGRKLICEKCGKEHTFKIGLFHTIEETERTSAP